MTIEETKRREKREETAWKEVQGTTDETRDEKFACMIGKPVMPFPFAPAAGTLRDHLPLKFDLWHRHV